jgi:hypothetical protein
MRVKIGSRIYSTTDQPIMLIFDTDQQRKTAAKHLSEMEDEDRVRKYCVFSANAPLSKETMEEFMKIPETE